MARVMVFNGLDWAPLDWDVPATAGNISHELNHSTMITLDVPAAYNAHLFEGHPRLYKDMAHVAVEDDTGRVFAGIVKNSPLSDGLSVTAHGHSVLSKEFPWHGSKGAWSGVDGITVFRSVWDHIIGHAQIPRLEIVGATSGGSKVGKDASPAWQNLTAQIEAAKVFVNRRENRVSYWERELSKRTRDVYRVSGQKRVGEISVASSAPGSSDIGTYKAVIETDADDRVVAVHFWEWEGVGGGSWLRFSGPNTLEEARRWRRTEHSLQNAQALYPTYVQRVQDLEAQREELYASGAPEPYELTWWDARDLSSNLEEIRELGNFDWHDTARWDGEDLIPQIRVLSGSRAVREDLHLEFGVNVHDAPELVPGDSASHIAVLGAGEGSGTIRAERRLDHPRLVPVFRTVSDKDFRTQQLADKAADKERDKARKALEPFFSALTVTDHPLAPISNFALGDRVPVVGELVDGSDYEGIVRVTSIQQDLGGSTIAVEVEHE